MIREKYEITEELYQEALRYAELSKRYTSDRHDFHDGSLEDKKRKMLEGKPGEKVFKMFLNDNHAYYIEDQTPFTSADKYDFMLIGNKKRIKIDVKTCTGPYHKRTLEMVEQAVKNPKDLYISARLYRDSNTVVLLGWFTREDMIKKNQIENQGYLDNYVIYDGDLRPMSELVAIIAKEFQK